MLDDIVKLTKKKKYPKNIYDTYLALKGVIEYINLVSEHYLVMDFSEDFLQNSSHGTPQEKWRVVLNEDLEKLNTHIKKYLSTIYIYTSDMYNAKAYYGYVNQSYDIGHIPPCSMELISRTITTKKFDSKNYYLEKIQKLDLTNYEQKVLLRDELRAKREILISYNEKLKEYILKRITIKDIL